jgi:hypothetical protein
MCGKQNTGTTIKVRRLEWAAYLVRMSDERTVRMYFWGNQKKSRRTNIKVLGCIENDMIPMGVKRWRSKEEDLFCMGCHSDGGSG